MTEGSGGFPRDDEDDALSSRPAGGRVFSLDDGGLGVAPDVGADANLLEESSDDTWHVEGDTPPKTEPAPVARAPLGWDEISAERLRESAANHQARGVFGEAEVAAQVGMAWYEVILGCLLGLAATLGMYELSAGGLGPFVVVPSIVLGFGLLAVPRHAIRHLGFGLLVSVPVAAALGFGLWYVTSLF